MNKQEHSFLCGLIREFRPDKVVEVGVAGGGTTAVIMKCLELVNPLAKMYSCDLNINCYRREGKMTGFQLEEIKSQLSNYNNHSFTGRSIAPVY